MNTDMATPIDNSLSATHINELEKSFQNCILSLTSQESFLPNDSEEIKQSVDHLLQNFLDTARRTETYFLNLRLQLSVQNPEKILLEEIADLHLELDRKEKLIEKYHERLQSWTALLHRSVTSVPLPSTSCVGNQPSFPVPLQQQSYSGSVPHSGSVMNSHVNGPPPGQYSGPPVPSGQSYMPPPHQLPPSYPQNQLTYLEQNVCNIGMERRICDLSNNKRRILLSAAQKETQVTPLHVRMPIHIVQRAVTSAHLKHCGKMSLARKEFSGSERMENGIQTFYEEFECYDDCDSLVAGQGTIPRHLQMTPDIAQLTQVLTVAKVLCAEKLMKQKVLAGSDKNCSGSVSEQDLSGKVGYHIAFGSKVPAAANCRQRSSRQASKISQSNHSVFPQPEISQRYSVEPHPPSELCTRRRFCHVRSVTPGTEMQEINGPDATGRDSSAADLTSGGAVSDTRAAMCLPSGDLTDIALENNLSASAANDAVVSSSPGGFADNQRNSGHESLSDVIALLHEDCLLHDREDKAEMVPAARGVGQLGEIDMSDDSGDSPLADEYEESDDDVSGKAEGELHMFVSHPLVAARRNASIATSDQQGRDCSVNIDRQGNRKSVSGALSVCGARLEDDFYSGQQPSIDDDCDCQYPVAWGMRARPHSEMTVGGRLATHANSAGIHSAENCGRHGSRAHRGHLTTSTVPLQTKWGVGDVAFPHGTCENHACKSPDQATPFIRTPVRKSLQLLREVSPAAEDGCLQNRRHLQKPYDHMRYQVADVTDSFEVRMLSAMKRQGEAELDDVSPAASAPANGVKCFPQRLDVMAAGDALLLPVWHHRLNESPYTTTSDDDTSFCMWKAPVPPPTGQTMHDYQEEMKCRVSGDTSTSNPRDRGMIFSPPILLPSQDALDGTLERRFEDLNEAGAAVAGEQNAADEELDLMFDPYLNCYYDPDTLKYYELAT